MTCYIWNVIHICRYRIFKDYVKSVISEMDIRTDRTRVGLLTFNEDVNVRFNLNAYSTKEDILQAVERQVK